MENDLVQDLLENEDDDYEDYEEYEEYEEEEDVTNR